MADPTDGRALIAAGVVKATADGCEIRVRAVPGASRDGVVGLVEGALRVRVSAPPVEGAANERLTKFLAKEVLSLPRSAVEIVGGERGRHKVLRVAATAELVAGRLAQAMREAG